MKADELRAPERARESDEQQCAVAEAMQRVRRQSLDTLAQLRGDERGFLRLGVQGGVKLGHGAAEIWATAAVAR